MRLCSLSRRTLTLERYWQSQDFRLSLRTHHLTRRSHGLRRTGERIGNDSQLNAKEAKLSIELRVLTLRCNNGADVLAHLAQDFLDQLGRQSQTSEAQALLVSADTGDGRLI